MWRLMISDSFHLRNANPTSYIYLIYFNIYLNLIIHISNSGYQQIVLIFSILMLLSLFVSPIQLAKGLYLCPLTEKDRKDYLKTICITRFILMEFLLVLIIIIIRHLYQVETIKLTLIFVCYSYVILTLLFLSGFYNPQYAKQQYYIANKLPIPKELKLSRENSRNPIVGIYMLITILVLSSIGMFLAFLGYSFDIRWLFYYIPALLVSTISMLIYFIRYFDIFITINANHEVYSYTRKKKVGAFHAD